MAWYDLHSVVADTGVIVCVSYKGVLGSQHYMHYASTIQALWNIYCSLKHTFT